MGVFPKKNIFLRWTWTLLGADCMAGAPLRTSDVRKFGHVGSRAFRCHDGRHEDREVAKIAKESTGSSLMERRLSRLTTEERSQRRRTEARSRRAKRGWHRESGERRSTLNSRSASPFAALPMPLAGRSGRRRDWSRSVSSPTFSRPKSHDHLVAHARRGNANASVRLRSSPVLRGEPVNSVRLRSLGAFPHISARSAGSAVKSSWTVHKVGVRPVVDNAHDR